MIEWTLITLNSDNEEVVIELTNSPLEVHTLKETDSVQFRVILDQQSFDELGIPYVVIGDMPLELDFLSYSEECYIYVSSAPLGTHKSKFFYNFFGESELGLVFDIGEKFFTSKVNILARALNGKLANDMLSYITDNLEDAVSICFSRSKIAGDESSSESFNFTRLDIVERSVKFFQDNLQLFVRVHKHNWQPNISLSNRGQPTGPDSVHWVLSNLDKLSRSSSGEANLSYNNRSYRLDILPKEDLVTESDIYENRVLHTFLHYISQFLFDLKLTFSSTIKSENSYTDNDYVRFDHTMQQFAKIALKHKIRHIDKLSLIVEQMRKVLQDKLPAKVVPGIQPRMTPYVAKHNHYLKAFKLIELCNSAPAPTFEGSKVLLGLKNLAIVYEVSALLLLNDSIKNSFSVELIDQSYRLQGQDTPFGGIPAERPYGEINNYFRYKSDIYDIEMLYEPKIYPFSSSSQEGDLVDSSDTKAHKTFGKHHYCPDFVVKISCINWRKPVTIILDAKYKDAATIKRFDISELTQKYLLNIHQVDKNGRLGVSPIQLLIILFAHERTGRTVRTVSRTHTLTSVLPVLPQSLGVLVKPKDSKDLDKQFESLINVINYEEALHII